MHTKNQYKSFNYNRRWLFNALCLLAGDALVIAFSLVSASLIRYVVKDGHIPPSRGFFLIPAWCFGAILLRLAPCWGIGAVDRLRRTQLLLISLFGLATVAMYLSKSADITSRIKFVVAYLINVPLIPLVRTWIISILVSLKKWGVPTVIYGTDKTVKHVLDIISEEPQLGYEPIGYFDDEKVGEELPIPRKGALHEYTGTAYFAIMGVSGNGPELLRELMEGPLSRYRRIIIIPDLLDIPSVWVSARDFSGMLGLEVIRNLLNPVARLSKQLVEWCLVALLLPIWGSAGGVIALLIWLSDRSSPFYRQQRVGRHGQVFMMYKFRSMVADAEQKLQKTLAENEALRLEWTGNHKIKEDPRITPIGRFLRRTSLDEIPQLINVLRGEMALVGPRPLPEYHYKHLSKSTKILREQVLPGVTGLWQVSGRSDAGIEGIERLDTYYVRNWSVWLDAVILSKTASAVWRGKGAY